MQDSINPGTIKRTSSTVLELLKKKMDYKDKDYKDFKKIVVVEILV